MAEKSNSLLRRVEVSHQLHRRWYLVTQPADDRRSVWDQCDRWSHGLGTVTFEDAMRLVLVFFGATNQWRVAP